MGKESLLVINSGTDHNTQILAQQHAKPTNKANEDKKYTAVFRDKF